ncbi:unnamed protein product [Calypogeia fissa]
MTAKVGDFGISKAVPLRYITNVQGTFGYLDPEYNQLGMLTHKSDLYSYGVVLAELISGLPPYKAETGIILVEQIRKLVTRNNIEALADPALQGAYTRESMWRMADIALACINPVGVNRPHFTQVVNDINEP